MARRETTPQRSRWFRGLCTAATALTLGCGTVDTRMNEGYEGPPVYSGARQSLSFAKLAFLQVNPFLLALALGDSVISAVADTVLLPITIPEQLQQNTESREHARLDIDQPSVVSQIKGEEPLRTAKRLYQTCSNYVINVNPRVTDCYAIDAKIKIEGGEELTGAEYKEKLREELAPLKGSGRFISLKEPKYEIAGTNVRVEATRRDPDSAKKSTLVWVVGPGSDGQWRILEEEGAGFP
jgi:uncharacterized protein YceK